MSDPCLVIQNATLIFPDRLLDGARIVIRNGIIEYIGTRRMPSGATVIDAKGGYVSPGYIDIHVHGGAGADFMDGTVEAVSAACMAHAQHGTTTIFPTTTTGSPAEIHSMIEACRACENHGARIAGIHLYGPFFAPDKVGCHSQEGRRDPLPVEFERYFATGMIRVATCAAELPGAFAFYKMAKKKGCFITCGHSNASWAEMEAAFKAGMRHVDHFWCAMSNVPSVRARLGTPMQGSMEQYVLMNREMSTEVIADGEHLSPELLEFAYRMIGPERLLLVTDSNRALDMAPGRYKFGHHLTGTDFEHDGKVGRALTGGLASSSMGMDHMVRVMKKSTPAPLWDVVRMASLTPAQRTGIDHETGSLEAGKRADVLILNSKLQVKRVFIGGVELVP